MARQSRADPESRHLSNLCSTGQSHHQPSDHRQDTHRSEIRQSGQSYLTYIAGKAAPGAPKSRRCTMPKQVCRAHLVNRVHFSYQIRDHIPLPYKLIRPMTDSDPQTRP